MKSFTALLSDNKRREYIAEDEIQAYLLAWRELGKESVQCVVETSVFDAIFAAGMEWQLVLSLGD